MNESGRESSLYFAQRSVESLLICRDALKGYVYNVGRVSESECPIARVAQKFAIEQGHGFISYFLRGPSRSWRCPYCHTEFRDGLGTEVDHATDKTDMS